MFCLIARNLYAVCICEYVHAPRVCTMQGLEDPRLSRDAAYINAYAQFLCGEPGAGERRKGGVCLGGGRRRYLYVDDSRTLASMWTMLDLVKYAVRCQGLQSSDGCGYMCATFPVCSCRNLTHMPRSGSD